MSNYTLKGINGNAYAIMAYIRVSMKECGKTEEEIEQYTRSAMKADYTNLLTVSLGMIDELNKI